MAFNLISIWCGASHLRDVQGEYLQEFLFSSSLTRRVNLALSLMHKKQTCIPLSLVCTFSPMFSPSSVQHPRRFSKCSISDFKEFLLKGGGSCLFNRPTKVRGSPLFIVIIRVTIVPFILLIWPAAVWENRMWKWICGNGRGVWLRSESSESPLSDCREVCCQLIQLAEAHPLCLQECYKECCKKCSLANSAQCSSGPCCNTTCLVCAWVSLLYNMLTRSPNLDFRCCSCQFFPRGYSCRYSVNDCDITETCSGDSGQVLLSHFFIFDTLSISGAFETIHLCLLSSALQTFTNRTVTSVRLTRFATDYTFLGKQKNKKHILTQKGFESLELENNALTSIKGSLLCWRV